MTRNVRGSYVRNFSPRFFCRYWRLSGGASYSGTFLRRTAGYAENANAVAEKVTETQCGHPQTRQPDRPGVAALREPGGMASDQVQFYLPFDLCR